MAYPKTTIFLLLTVLAVLLSLKRQQRGLRTVFDPAILTVILFAFCYLVPALSMLNGPDASGEAPPEAIETVSLYGIVFVVTFVCTYEVLRSACISRFWSNRHISFCGTQIRWFFVVLTMFSLLKIALAHYGVTDFVEYSQQYLNRQSLPQMVSQGLNVLTSLEWFAIYVLIAYCCSSYATIKSRLCLVILFLVFAADAFFTESRSNFVTLSLAAIGAYGFYGRRLGVLREILFCIGLVALMEFFSRWRSGSGGGGEGNLWVASEFISIYNNAIHILTSPFITPPGSSYLQSLIQFIPKQLNPEKWDLADWFVREYFPGIAKNGGGMAFGVIPEAMVNYGLLSMAAQACFIACLIHGALTGAIKSRGKGVTVRVVFFIFLYSQIYQMIRNNSLAIVGGLVIAFLFPLFIASILGQTTLLSRFWRTQTRRRADGVSAETL